MAKGNEEPKSQGDWADQITKSLFQESDRGCIVIGVALLDEMLIKNLKGVFRTDPGIQKKVVQPLFEANGFLNSFSHRINLAYALGMISSDAHHDLHLLRKLRNEVAHLYGPKSFQDPAIRARIRSLRLTPTHTKPAPVDYRDGHFHGDEKKTREIMVERLAFMLALSDLHGRLGAAAKLYASILDKPRAYALKLVDGVFRMKRGES